jgi:hypothetical protein
VRVSPQPAEQLAACLPDLPRVGAALDPAPAPREPLERFDVDSARWVHVDSIDEPGAFRTAQNGRLYFFVGPGDLVRGECRVTGPRLAKHLAAATCSRVLVSYDRAAKAISVPLGAELPGLYARAAVLASGRVPQRLGRRSVYQGVPEAVAHTLLARLSAAVRGL